MTPEYKSYLFFIEVYDHLIKDFDIIKKVKCESSFEKIINWSPLTKKIISIRYVFFNKDLFSERREFIYENYVSFSEFDKPSWFIPDPVFEYTRKYKDILTYTWQNKMDLCDTCSAIDFIKNYEIIK